MKILSTKRVYESRWINVFERVVESFKGRRHIWTMVSRQKDPETCETKKPDAVVIVALHYDDEKVARLVITSEYRPAIGGREIGFPAGLIEEGQTPEEAAIREMREETGLTLEVDRVSPNLYSSAGMTNESVVYVFGVAKGTISDEFLEPGEDITVSFATLEEVEQLLESKENVSARAWPIMLLFENNAGLMRL